ncbi:hypothetical protein BJX66DRAFT_320705, partial [Aspergillus keveii]
MRDFQENPKRVDRKDSTNAVFDSYAGFKNVGELTSKFHQIVSNLDWEDKAYRSWYYNILKPEIKDAM